MTKTDTLISEMERVFGAAASLLDEADGVATVALEGWPSPVQYRVDAAVTVLAMYRTGAGQDAEGDAAICAALERAGAVVE